MEKKIINICKGDSIDFNAQKVPWTVDTPDFILKIHVKKLYCYTEPQKGFGAFWEWLKSRRLGISIRRLDG